MRQLSCRLSRALKLLLLLHRPHEAPLRVVFIDEPFTQANGMRNANFKLLWTKVEETYTDEIKKAFAEPLTAEETHRLQSGGGH